MNARVFSLVGVISILYSSSSTIESSDIGKRALNNGDDAFLGVGLEGRQYEALRLFFYSTRMDSAMSKPFNNWMFGNESIAGGYCDFTGITCEGGFVTSLNLNNSGLSGSLPDVFDDFPNLQRLRLYNNSIAGVIPDSVTRIPRLRFLNLGYNYFSGDFPDFFQLDHLSRVYLQRNAIGGTLPSSLCKMTTLEVLDISYDTKMQGHIPPCLGGVLTLSTFRVTDVGLSGTVPAELCGGRNINGLSPNPFGCNAIACPIGSFQHTVGRQTGERNPCVPCSVPSNVIGTTNCQWNDFFNRTVSPSPGQSPLGAALPSKVPVPAFFPLTGAPSIAPFTPPSSPQPTLTVMPATVQPSLDATPLNSSSAAPSNAPFEEPSPAPTSNSTINSPTIAPSSVPLMLTAPATASFVPSQPPTSAKASAVPTLYTTRPSAPVFIISPATTRPVPVGRPNTVPGISVDSGTARDFTRSSYFIAGATACAVCVAILALLLAWKRRKSSPTHIRMADDVSSDFEQSLHELGASKDARIELSSDIFDTASEELSATRFNAASDDILGPVSRRAPPILKNNLSRDLQFPISPTGGFTRKQVRFDFKEPPSRATSGVMSNESSAAYAKGTKDDRDAWLLWTLYPLFDPINSCGARCRGTSHGDLSDSMISFRSSTFNARAAESNRTDAYPPSPPALPDLHSLLGIRDRDVLDDDSNF